MTNDLYPVTYQFKSDFDSHQLGAPLFQRMKSPFYKGERWAVRRLSFCLGRDLEWHHEPIPSNRDAEFYDKCRFDDLDQALSAYQHSLMTELEIVKELGRLDRSRSDEDARAMKLIARLNVLRDDEGRTEAP